MNVHAALEQNGFEWLESLICRFFSTMILEKISEIFNSLKKLADEILKKVEKICYEYIKHVDT